MVTHEKESGKSGKHLHICTPQKSQVRSSKEVVTLDGLKKKQIFIQGREEEMIRCGSFGTCFSSQKKRKSKKSKTSNILKRKVTFLKCATSLRTQALGLEEKKRVETNFRYFQFKENRKHLLSQTEVPLIRRECAAVGQESKQSGV